MPVYRYKVTGLDINKIKKQVPPADASSVSSGSSAALVVWDVTAPTTSKDDIDAYMLSRGWSFVETDPSSTPQEASDAAIEAATPAAHDLAGSLHNADTLADLNAKISDATLDTNTASRPPSGAAGGDLSGTYPNPTVPHVALTNNPHGVTAAQAGAPPTSRNLTAGAGLTGGGDLSADRTFNAVANADGSIAVNADDIQVGVLATDAQHGVRGGGTQHAAATTTVAGFMSGADKTKLDGVATGATNTPLSDTAPADVTKAAASAGVATEASRRDHKHDVATASAVDVGTASAEGSSTSLARADHTHKVTGLGIASEAQGDILYRNASAWVRLAAGVSGHFLKTNGAAANPEWAEASGGSGFPIQLFQADQLESPNSSDWTVNALAPLIPDASNVALSVRAFDDTTDEGIGFTVKVPTGATNIILGFLSRAATAPASTKAVALDLYKRAVPDNAVIPAWSSATSLTDISIPTNAYYQKDSQTIALATLGLTAGVTYTFELCRDADAGADTLAGDWLLHSLTVDWS